MIRATLYQIATAVRSLDPGVREPPGGGVVPWSIGSGMRVGGSLDAAVVSLPSPDPVPAARRARQLGFVSDHSTPKPGRGSPPPALARQLGGLL